jgi:hypothetical protein
MAYSPKHWRVRKEVLSFKRKGKGERGKEKIKTKD